MRVYGKRRGDGARLIEALMGTGSVRTLPSPRAIGAAPFADAIAETIREVDVYLHKHYAGLWFTPVTRREG